MIVVGEIGISPDRFRELQWWELRSIIRGYHRRNREMWSAIRWQTYNIMTAQVGGSEAMAKAGLHSVTSLLAFPWERQRVSPITDDEHDELEKELEAFRRK